MSHEPSESFSYFDALGKLHTGSPISMEELQLLFRMEQNITKELNRLAELEDNN